MPYLQLEFLEIQLFRITLIIIEIQLFRITLIIINFIKGIY